MAVLPKDQYGVPLSGLWDTIGHQLVVPQSGTSTTATAVPYDSYDAAANAVVNRIASGIAGGCHV